MNYVEIDLFGVYVAPIVPMIVLAWVVMWPLRWISERYALMRFVWHPALVGFSVYLMLLAVIVLAAGTWW
jgi:hypothetical protein